MKGYITNIPSCDGMGARIQRMIYLMYFSYYIREKYNKELEFIYMPLSYEGFGKFFYDRPVEQSNYYYVTKENYRQRAIKWDEKLSYRGKKIYELDLNSVHIVYNPTFQEIIHQIENNNFDEKLYLFDQMCFQFDDNTIDDDFVYKYQQEVINSFNLINPFRDDKMNISLHIRRDDIGPNFGFRWLSDEYYLEIIDIIERNLDKNDYNLRIHTQRDNFNFEKFKGYDVLYDEIYEDYDSFVELIFSDILIMGKSAFSYAPAFLNKNLVVYHDFWHKKLEWWIKKEDLENKLKNKYK